jgi:pimeloyl-ACP methyl ester carboxylesterase
MYLSIAKKMIIYLAVGYLSAVSLLYLLHERIVFQPDRLSPDYAFRFDQPFEEFFLDDPSNGLQVNALYFPAPADAKGVILYFHGNADNLQRWGGYAGDFTELGYHVLAVDYPGYGKSPGTPSEENCYRSAALAYQWARKRFPAEKIIIYGRSLGSGIASWLAARQPAQQLILETPFPNIPAVFRYRASALLIPLPLKTSFPVADYLNQVDYPVTIFHGTRDLIIPYKVALALHPTVGADRFITIAGAGHKNLSDYALYHENLGRLLN